MKKILFILAAVLLASCTTTKLIEVERVKTDTTYVTKQQRDSIWLHDSVLIKEKGDTLWVERWHTKYVERTRTDTLIRHRTDSVPVPYPVEKLIEKKLSWWQQLRLSVGNAALVAILIFAVVKYLRLRNKGA